MAAIFVNLAGMREAISGHLHFVPAANARKMQRHYMLYRAAYNCSWGCTCLSSPARCIKKVALFPAKFALPKPTQDRSCYSNCVPRCTRPLACKIKSMDPNHSGLYVKPLKSPIRSQKLLSAWSPQVGAPIAREQRLEHLVYDQTCVTSPIRTATYSDEDLAPWISSLARLWIKGILR